MMYTYVVPHFIIYSEIQFNCKKHYKNANFSSKNNVTNIYIMHKAVPFSNYIATSINYVSKNFVVKFNHDSVLVNLNQHGILMYIHDNFIDVTYNKLNEHIVTNNLLELIIPYLYLKQGYLTLHAAACKYKGKTVLFTADSGVGKTTLLLHLLNKGAEYISDDIVCIYNVGDQYSCIGLDITLPKATDDTIKKFAIPEGKIIRTNGITNKSYISLGDCHTACASIDAIILLNPNNSLNTIKITKNENYTKKFLEQTVGIWGMSQIDMIKLMYKWNKLSSEVSVYSLTYRKNYDFLEQCTVLLESKE